MLDRTSTSLIGTLHLGQRGSLVRNPRCAPGLCARSSHSCRAIAGIAPPSVRRIGHFIQQSSLDGDKIIHTRSRDLGVPLEYNVAGTVARRSGG
jgi:hypothetical protein